MITGETLRFIRNIKGIKQETLARQLGISQPAYCKLEKKERISKDRWEFILSKLNFQEGELEIILKLHLK